MDEIFLILLGIAWAVGTPIIAIVALVRTGRLREQNERLIGEVAYGQSFLGTNGATVLDPSAA